MADVGFNIANFQAGLTHQGARPNLFQMQLTAPLELSVVGWTTLCKTAQIPGSTIGVVEVQYFGRPVKMPGNRTFENLTTTIINDEDFVLRHSMEKWMSFLNSHQANKSAIAGGTAGFEKFTGTLTLTQYSKDGKADVKPYVFKKCWPVNVAVNFSNPAVPPAIADLFA
jgi:hypothetical protein